MVEKILCKSALSGNGIRSPGGLGVMQFSGGAGMMGKAFPVLSQEEKTSLVKAALDGGVNWFDTAELYGFGQSERNLSEALQSLGIREGEVVVTNGSRFSGPRAISREHRVRLDVRNPSSACYTSPSFLRRRRRWTPWQPGSRTQIRSVGMPTLQRRAHAQTATALANNRAGTNQILQPGSPRIKAMGPADGRNWASPVAYPVGIRIIKQNFPNPDLLANKGFFYRARLKRGIETTRPLVAAMEKIGEKYAATVGQVALSWLVSFHGETVLTIPGATKVHQVEQNAGALKFQLSQEELDQLDQLSKAFL
jgi:hypothetical protein